MAERLWATRKMEDTTKNREFMQKMRKSRVKALVKINNEFIEGSKAIQDILRPQKKPQRGAKLFASKSKYYDYLTGKHKQENMAEFSERTHSLERKFYNRERVHKHYNPRKSALAFLD